MNIQRILTLLKVFPCLLLSLGAVPSTANSDRHQDANAKQSGRITYVFPDSFACLPNDDGVLATYAIKGSRDLDIIAWEEEWSAKYTPEERCNQVSGRFAKASRDRRLEHLTNGWMNGSPVICTAEYAGGPCDRLMVTLRHRDADRAEDILRYLEIRGRGGGNGPIPMSEDGSEIPMLVEAGDQVYINMNAVFYNTLS